MPSDWQNHAIETLPARSGQKADAVVVGPTCTAYDRLVRRPLPKDLGVGGLPDLVRCRSLPSLLGNQVFPRPCQVNLVRRADAIEPGAVSRGVSGLVGTLELT
jgi:hypothetical protein